MTTYYGMKCFNNEKDQEAFIIYANEAYLVYTGKKWMKYVDNFLFREFERVKHICHVGSLPYMGNKYYKDTDIQERWLMFALRENGNYTGKDVYDYIDMHCYVEFERKLTPQEGYRFMHNSADTVVEAFNNFTLKAAKVEEKKFPEMYKPTQWISRYPEPQIPTTNFVERVKQTNVLESDKVSDEITMEQNKWKLMEERERKIRATMPIFDPKYAYNQEQFSLLTPSQQMQVRKKTTQIATLLPDDQLEKDKRARGYYNNLHYQMNVDGIPAPTITGKMVGIEANLYQTTEQAQIIPAYTSNTINENWSITDIASRPYRMPAFIWNTSQGHLTTLYELSARLAPTYNQQLAVMIRPFKYYRYKSMHVNLLMKTTRFCTGALSIRSLYSRENVDSDEVNYTCTRNIYQAMNAEEPDMILPYFNQYNWLPISLTGAGTAWDSSIFMGVQVWNQLFLPAGKGTQVSVVPVIHFEGFEVMFPITPITSILSSMDQEVQYEGKSSEEIFYYPSSRHFIEPLQGALMGNVHGATQAPSFAIPETTIWDFISHPWIVDVLTIPVNATNFETNILWFHTKNSILSPVDILSKYIAYAAGGFKYKMTITKDGFTTGNLAIVANPYGSPTPASNTWQNFPHLIWNLEESHEFEFVVGNYGPRTLWEFGSNLTDTPNVTLEAGFPLSVHIFQVNTFMSSEGSSPNIYLTIQQQPYEGDKNGNGRFQLFMIRGVQGPPHDPNRVRRQPNYQTNKEYKVLGRLNPPVTDNGCELEEVIDMADLTTRAWPLYDLPAHPLDMPTFNINPSELNGRNNREYSSNMASKFAKCYLGWKGGFTLSLKSDRTTEIWRIIPKQITPSPGLMDINHNYGAMPPSLFITGATYAVLTTPTFCPLNYYASLGHGTTEGYQLVCTSFTKDENTPIELEGFAQTTRDFQWYFWGGLPPSVIIEMTFEWSNMVDPILKRHISDSRLDIRKSLFAPNIKSLQLEESKISEDDIEYQMFSQDANKAFKFTNLIREHAKQKPMPPKQFPSTSSNIFSDVPLDGGEDDSDGLNKFIKLNPIGKVKNLLDHTFETLENVDATTKKAKSMMDAFDYLPSKVNETLDNLNNMMSNPLEHVKAYLTTHIGTFSDTLYGILLELIDLYISDKSIAKIALFGLKMANLLGIGIDAIYNIIKMASGVFPTQVNKGIFGYQAQANNQVLNILTLGVALVGMKMTGATDIDPKRMKNSWDYLSVRCRDMSNIKSGVTAFMDGFKEMRELVKGAAYEMFGIEFLPSEEGDAMNKFAENLKLMGECVEAFSQPKVFAQLSDSPALISKVESIHKLHGENLAIISKYPDLPRNIIAGFNMISRQLKALFDAISENAVTAATKLVPFHIRIVGEPGVGKSVLIQHVASLLCSAQQIEPIVYYNASGVEYKDGLQPGTNVLVRDDGDMNQSESLIGLEIINLVSPIPMVQNMADLTKKGRFANYKFIITTGNVSHPTYNNITGDAWLRRTHLLVNAKRDKSNQDPFDCYSFAYHNPIDVNLGYAPIESKKTGQRRLTFDEFAKDIIIKSSQHFVQEMKLNNITKEIDFTPVMWHPENGNEAAALIKTLRDQHKIKSENIQWRTPPPTFKPVDLIIVHEPPQRKILKYEGKTSEQKEGISKRMHVSDDYIEVVEGNPLEVSISVSEKEYKLGFYDRFKNEHRETQIDVTELLHMLGNEVRQDTIEGELQQQLMSKSGIATVMKKMLKMTPYMILDYFIPYEVDIHELKPDYIEAYEIWKKNPTSQLSWQMWLYHQFVKSALRRELHCRKMTQMEQEYQAYFNLYRSETPLFLLVLREKCDLRPTYDFIMAVMYPVTMHATRGFFGPTKGFYKGIMHYCSTVYENVTTLLNSSSRYMKILAAVMTAYYIYIKFIKPVPKLANLIYEGESVVIQGKEHLDLPDDNERHLHAHVCENRTCRRIFSHTHRKEPLVEGRYSMKCRNCRDKEFQKMTREAGPTLFEIDDEEAEIIIYENHAYDNSTVKGRNYKPVVFESFSYDHTTLKGRPPRYISVEKGEKLKNAFKKEIHFESFTEESPTTIPNHFDLKSDLQPTTIVNPTPHGNIKNVLHETFKYRDNHILYEGTTDENCTNVRRKLARNIGMITHVDGTIHNTINFIGLREKKLVTTFHLIQKQWDEGMRKFEFIITYQNMTKRVILTRADITAPSRFMSKSRGRETYTDMMIINLEKVNMNSFSDIVHLFAREIDFPKNMMGSGAFLVVLNNDTIGPNGSKIHMVDSYYTQSIRLVHGLAPPNGQCSALWALEYDLPTRNGWCGSPFIINNVLVQNKIAGMHYCGSGDMGGSIPLYQELLLAALGPIESPSFPDTQDLVYHLRTDVVHEVNPLEGISEYIGVMKNPTKIMRRTDLTPSPIYDKLYKHVTEPAPLSMNDPRLNEKKDPVMNGINKFSKAVPYPTYDIRQKSVQTVTKMLLEPYKYDNKRTTGVYRILTTEEAINGDGMYVEPLNMKSSAGFPFTKTPGKGKYKMMKVIGNYEDGRVHYEPNTELQYYITSIEQELFDKGIPTFNYYQDQPKDERRKIPRVQQGNTRLYNIGNLAWLIVKKKYYWWLYEYAKTHMTDIRLGIGFNMFGSDPTRLYRHLTRIGVNNCSDGDVKEWDGKFGPDVWDDTSEISRRVASVLIIKVDKETLRRIKLVGMSAKYRIHICEDMIYIVIWGMPSGDFLTALFNSIGHLQKDCCIWNIFWMQEDAMGRKSYTSDEWIILTYCCKMGDDDINSVSDEIRDIYTPSERQKIWVHMEYEYTDATKSGEMKYKSIKEVSFLKCEFKTTEYPDFVKMGIDQTYVIQELTNWIRIGQDSMDALISNLEDSLRFAHAYGEDTFEHYKQQFNNALNEKQVPLLTINYDELESEWLRSNGIGYEPLN